MSIDDSEDVVAPTSGAIVKVRRVDLDVSRIYIDRLPDGQGWMWHPTLADAEPGDVYYVPDNLSSEEPEKLPPESWPNQGSDIATVLEISHDGVTAILEVNGKMAAVPQRTSPAFESGQTVAYSSEGEPGAVLTSKPIDRLGLHRDSPALDPSIMLIEPTDIDVQLSDFGGSADLVDRALNPVRVAPGTSLAARAESVSVAGVTELPLYWKDARRVLFDRSEYTVYARLARSGLDTTWSPVKIADIFDSVSKDVGNQIRQLPLAFANQRSAGVEVLSASIPEILETHGLIPFGSALARATSREPGNGVLEHAARSAAQAIVDIEKLSEVGAVRAAFEQVVAAVESSPPLVLSPINRDLMAELREPFQDLARLRAALPAVEEAVERCAVGGSDEHLLEVEFVAIYW